MGFEVQNYKAEVLTMEEKELINTAIDRYIDAMENNRCQINRCVVDCVSALTEADSARLELSQKSWWRRIAGGISGDNQRLQNIINNKHGASQEALRLMLQRMAERDIFTFEVISAIRNKLTAVSTKYKSLEQDIITNNQRLNNHDKELIEIYHNLNREFDNIYGLIKRCSDSLIDDVEQQNKRLRENERNIHLLQFENHIDIQTFNGKPYEKLNLISKIVCLARDFYNVTNGEWNDLELYNLKTPMKKLHIGNHENINYLQALVEIAFDEDIKNYYLGDFELMPIYKPERYNTLAVLEKLDKLIHEESYLVDTVLGELKDCKENNTREYICKKLANNFFKYNLNCDFDIEVDSYDLLLDLLFNLCGGQQDGFLVKNRVETEKKLSREKIEKIVAEKIYNEAELMWTDDDLQEELPLQVALYKIAAVYGNITAQVELGDLYSQYSGSAVLVNQDIDEAIKWYSMAANKGNIDAQLNLGFIYSDEDGWLDFSKAIKWFGKAAEQGNARAQYELGAIYCKENGVEQDYEKAVKWFGKAAEQGNATAQYNLGLMYEYGKGVEQDKAIANDWFHKAAENGHSAARIRLGMGVPRKETFEG